MLSKSFFLSLKFCDPLHGARSGLFIGDLDAYVSNRANESKKTLGSDLYYTRVCTDD